MQKYEYVTRKEYQPIRVEIEEIIKAVQNELSKVVTFQFNLIGSGNRHLITRKIGGNEGYDFDYNLAIQRIFNDGDDDAKKLKSIFINAFRRVLAQTYFDDPENSTSVFTIKRVYRQAKKILYGCDFAIINHFEKDGITRQEYIKFNKQQSSYSWEERPIARNYADKVALIKQHQLWQNVNDCITKQYFTHIFTHTQLNI